MPDTARTEMLNYGGQAVIEGVMIRGERSVAVAVRRPDGEIATQTTDLSALYRSPLRRVPLLRGILVLWETFALGIRALTWAAGIAADEVDEQGEPHPLGVAGWLTILIALTIGVGIFFGGPVLLAAWLESYVDSSLAVVAIEGVIRIALLIGYVWLIGRSKEIERVFQYHGAEHMAIHAFEQRAITPESLIGTNAGPPPIAAVRRFERAHPRCGTSFLLTVAFVAVIVFALLGTPPLWWRLLSRIVFIPVVAGIAYEAIRLAGRHSSHWLVHWLFAANLALQRLTTREPDDEQIQVAVAALTLAVVSDQAPSSGAAAEAD
jgi:uncharacterized protein YqhQ